MEDLERYIAEHSALVSASPGLFTIDPVRQRKLLGELGLEDARLGFLKLAQAAVISKSGGLHFEIGRELRVRFTLTQPLPVPWWDVRLSDQSWKSCLTLGLLALSQSYELDWEWKFGSQGWSGRSGPIEYTQKPTCDSKLENSFRCSLKPIGPRKWFRVFPWTSGLEKWLSPRLAWMPIPVSRAAST